MEQMIQYLLKMTSNGSDTKDAFGSFHFHCVSLYLKAMHLAQDFLLYIITKLEVCIENGTRGEIDGRRSTFLPPPSSRKHMKTVLQLHYFLQMDFCWPTPSPISVGKYLAFTSDIPSSALFKPRISLPTVISWIEVPIELNSSHELFCFSFFCFNDYKLIVFRQ